MSYTQNDRKRNSILWIIGGIFIFIITFVITNQIYNKKPTINYENMLKDRTKEIIYRLETPEIDAKDHVPQINMSAEKINEINQEIINSYNDYLTKYTDGFTYRYNISGNILSLLITSKQRYHDATHYDITYKAYNIDLTNLSVLTEEQLWKQFNITEEQLRYFLTYKFVNYYKDLLEKKYFTEKECSYECFIENRNFVDYLKDNQYYINNHQLEIYKYFNIFTEYKEEDYFTEDSFHFIIK